MGLISGLFRKVRRRRYKRFRSRGNAYVVISTPQDGDPRQVQIIDISQGGMAFIYQGDKEGLVRDAELSLFDEEAMYLDKIGYEDISDIAINGDGDENYRRHSVRFKWLGVLDRTQLKRFIKKIR